MNRFFRFLALASAGLLIAGEGLNAKADSVATANNPPELKPVVDGPEGQRAFDDLAKAYASHSGLFNDKAVMADLKSPDAAKAHSAAKYLLALFEQTSADQSNGRTGQKIAPFFNESEYNPALILREDLVKDFGSSASSEAALPAALWLIENDPIADNAEAGAHVLARLHSDAADAAIGQIINEVHPNQEVLVTAIKEAGLRHLTSCKDGVITLEQSYRKAVREAAVRAAAKLGETKPVPYDPLKAFSPRVLALLKMTLDRIQMPVSGDAQWLDGVAKPDWSPGKPYPVHGWLVNQNEKETTYLDVFGRVLTVTPDRVQFTPGTLAHTAKAYADLRATCATLAAQLHAIDDQRNSLKFNSPEWKKLEIKRQQLYPVTENLLKEMTSGMTYIPAPDNRFLNLPEMTVAAWCWQRGDLASTAAVLFPCYDAARDDRLLDTTSRDDLANEADLELIQRFAVERNSPAAIALATHLGTSAFDGYIYRARSRELAAQLATRSEDFTTLTLPSAADWARIKTTLDRPQQITWLASHLKLMHCINPGYDEVQYAFPYPHDHAPQGAPEVINPYNELLQLDLTPADLLILAPFAGDKDFSPSYTFYKDWIPERGFCRVSDAVGAIINQVAGTTLVHSTETGIAFANRSESDVVADLQAWVAAHHDDTPDKVLAKTLSTSTDYQTLNEAAIQALKIHHVEILGLLADRIEEVTKNAPNAEAQQGGFIHLFYGSYAPMVDRARRWMKSPYPEVRLWASLILIRDGDTKNDEGFDTLEPLLTGPLAVPRYVEAAPTLLTSASPRARRVAAGVFPLIHVNKGEGNGLGIGMDEMYQSYFLAGRKECLDFLLAALDDYTINPNVGSADGTPSYYSDCVVQYIGMWDWHHLRQQPRTEPALHLYRAQLKEWLKAQFALVQKGEPAAFKYDMMDQYSRYLIQQPIRHRTAEEAAGTQD